MTTFTPRFAPDIAPLGGDGPRSPAYQEQLPFHVPQRDDQSCGLASLTQVTCALLARRAAPPVTQDAVAALLGKLDWTGGATLAELEAFTRRTFAALGVAATVTRRHAVPGAEAAFRDALRAVQAGRAHVIVNVCLAAILGSPFGHHSPVAAYDEPADRVLVLDTYRQGWEPWWAPVARVLDAMSVPDPDAGEPRGWLVITPSNR
jgi:hypothetical protein